jgi:hypothetical protein
MVTGAKRGPKKDFRAIMEICTVHHVLTYAFTSRASLTTATNKLGAAMDAGRVTAFRHSLGTVTVNGLHVEAVTVKDVGVGP